MDENTPNDIKQEKIQKETKVYTQKEVSKKILETTLFCLSFTLIIAIFLSYLTCNLYYKYKNFFKDIDISKFVYIDRLYREEYIGNYDQEKAMDAALSALVESTNDKYGAYIPSKNYDFTGSQVITGNYKGIGILLELDPEKEILLIQGVNENSPADKAGLKKGQTITKINNQKITTEYYIEIMKLLREQAFDTIDFEIDYTDNVTIKIGEVITPKIKYEIKDNIGYIKIYKFLDTTEEDFKKAIDYITSQNINKLIFDLRDNAGGNADIVIPMLDYILEDGLIGTFEYQKGEETKTYYSDKESKLPNNIPIYILANNKTASASEFFIMNLQDHKNAKLIGQKTYGKNTILSVITFEDKSIICFSSGYYYSLSHRHIEDIGIPPDIELNDQEIELDWTELTQYYN